MKKWPLALPVLVLLAVSAGKAVIAQSRLLTGPDLAAESVEITITDKYRIMATDVFVLRIDATVRNRGSKASPACQLDFLKMNRSPTLTPPSYATSFEKQPVPALEPMAHAVISTSGNIHWKQGDRIFYYGFVVDQRNIVKEPDDVNNALKPAEWKKFPD